MATRARTRAATAAAAAAAAAVSSVPAPQQPPQPTPKSKTNSTRKSTAASIAVKQEHPHVADPSDKENIKTTTTSYKAPATRKPKSRSIKNAYCTCTKGDDGSPMIRCAECKVWYHFICVDLTEHEAEEINVYICPLCTQSTGRKTAMTWEGIEALDDCGSDVETIASKATAQKLKKRKPSVSTKVAPSVPPLHPPPSSEESENESEDDYVADDTNAKSKGKRRLRHRSSSHSESDASSDDETTRKRKTKSRRISRSRTPVSPVVQSRLKRKSNVAESSQTPVKRKKTETATDDPVRKYCLGKLEQVFGEVFFRYPHVHRDASVEVESDHEHSADDVIFKKLEDMSDEEKEALTNASKRFAAELEQCVFDIYSEPDKNNAPHPGGKYKDRFRMLQFNLSKPDRTVIHKRIINSQILPKEISMMSSTDLADEETKQHIKIAEKEALAQTILEKPIVPRAKITHKGLQDIEDVTGEHARLREAERQREREQEEEERREREKRERLKAVEKQRQRTQSLSVPPESPVVPSHSPVGITGDGSSSSSWGAPPPIPAHVLQQQGTSAVGDDILPSQSIGGPAFTNTSIMSDVEMVVTTPEPELRLADLINIDEDGGEHESGGASVTGISEPGSAEVKSGAGVAPIPVTDQSTEPKEGASEKNHAPPLQTISGLGEITASPRSPVTPVVGISPFSSTRPRGLSFDLNSLWSGQKDDDISHTPKSPTPAAREASKSANGNDVPKTGVIGGGGGGGGTKAQNVMESERMEIANDDDFDMFLEEKDETLGARPPSTGPTEPEPHVNQDPEAIFETIQQCWTGKIHMPLDSAAPQSTTVLARQIGGRALDHQSPWWKTLFPSEELRIDGRVATQSSSEFLTQVRLNPAKELIAVAFSPVSEGSKADFAALTDYLKSRDRHGLIFPWGQRPKEWAPGRELYLIPLLASEPLPLYIELLDELKIPKTRKVNYMIGIWILGRGKLNGPPPALSSATPTSVPPAPTLSAPPVMPPMIPNIPTLPPHLTAPTASFPQALPNLTSAINAPPHSGLPPQVNQAALAKEVASLSQDQIQNLLKTLSTTNLPFNIPIPGGPSQGQPPHNGPPPPPPQWPGFPMPGPLPPPPPPPHGGYPPPGFGGPRPPLPPPPPPQGPPMDDRRDSYPPPHGHHPGGRNGGDRDRDRGSGWRGGREGRQHRGRGKHRGGGGSGGGGGPNLPPRPVDSGWPRRQKGDGGDGRSPGRRW